ncbi:MAG: TRAP transporter small permease [Planctomycetes bacterium]|nr:TRAP transporter small permease [Planctomycetota bacterium]
MTWYEKVLRRLITVMIWLSGAGILAMIAVTFIDIVFRLLRIRFTGAVDIVQIAGAVSIAAALPYTTAVNAHVAIEFVLHKLSHRGRLVMGSIIKIMTIALFVFAAHRSFLYGNDLRAHNQGTMTLRFPMCWMMYMIAVCLTVVVLVVLYSLLKPRKELIKL